MKQRNWKLTLGWMALLGVILMVQIGLFRLWRVAHPDAPAWIYFIRK